MIVRRRRKINNMVLQLNMWGKNYLLLKILLSLVFLGKNIFLHISPWDKSKKNVGYSLQSFLQSKHVLFISLQHSNSQKLFEKSGREKFLVQDL